MVAAVASQTPPSEHSRAFGSASNEEDKEQGLEGGRPRGGEEGRDQGSEGREGGTEGGDKGREGRELASCRQVHHVRRHLAFLEGDGDSDRSNCRHRGEELPRTGRGVALVVVFFFKVGIFALIVAPAVPAVP